MAVATDCNPGTSPLTSLLLAMNMAATLFRLTVDECLAGVTRKAARALGLDGESARWSRASGATWRSGTSSGRRSWSTGSGSTRCIAGSGGDDERDPDSPGRGDARRLAAPSIGARGCALDPAARPLVACAPAAVAAHRCPRRAVYGINTGFGKLASVRIAAGDLATLQRNLVLSHAAGVGEPMPVPVARLMMALKLASLAQGASGVRPATMALLGGDAGPRPDPGGARARGRWGRRATWPRSPT